jgi:hypothetical protein
MPWPAGIATGCRAKGQYTVDQHNAEGPSSTSCLGNCREHGAGPWESRSGSQPARPLIEIKKIMEEGVC